MTKTTVYWHGKMFLRAEKAEFLLKIYLKQTGREILEFGFHILSDSVHFSQFLVFDF